MIADLKSCPFCGVEPHMDRTNIDLTTESGRDEKDIYVWWQITCPKCRIKKEAVSVYRFQGDETIVTLKDGKTQAVELWNRRADNDNCT